MTTETTIEAICEENHITATDAEMERALEELEEVEDLDSFDTQQWIKEIPRNQVSPHDARYFRGSRIQITVVAKIMEEVAWADHLRDEDRRCGDLGMA